MHRQIKIIRTRVNVGNSPRALMRKLLAPVPVAVVSILAGASTAQGGEPGGCTPQENHKLVASDAAQNDFFGISVAISGNTAIIGSPGDDDGIQDAGSAYLFDVATGKQLMKLTALDAAAVDYFGYSVAISGNIAIVGAPFRDGEAGSAYLFNVNTGQQIFKLIASDAAPDDYFGRSVAISGNTAIVGARGDDDGGSESGSAYLFDVATGRQLFKLTASDAASQNLFGDSVAISGNTAIVGAPLTDAEAGDYGAAYLFDVSSGQQLFKLTASDGAAQDWFGDSVALSGNTAIVGAYGDDDGGNVSGSAYLFDVATGQQLFKLTASEAAPNVGLGYAVAISGNTAMVGAPHEWPHGSDPGSAYLFDVTTGQQLFKLTASDAAAQDRLGISIAISGNRAIAGAWLNDDGGTSSGSAYLFNTKPCDITGDGIVDVADLLAVINQWGACPAPPALCPADLDGDGAVAVGDLLIVINNWS